jgi:putative sigma-54 modulation protein
VEKLRQRARVNVHVRGRDIFVHCDDGDLYAAIDDLVDKLDRSIQRHKAHVRVRPQAAFKRNGESSAEEEA